MQTCIWPSCCHCHSLSLASVKSRLVLPFWYRLTQVVPEKGPLNVCVCVCVSMVSKKYLDVRILGEYWDVQSQYDYIWFWTGYWWHRPCTMWSRVCASIGHLSVYPSMGHCSKLPAAGLLLWAGQAGDVIWLVHGTQQYGGQCQVVSVRRKLNTDLFFGNWQSVCDKNRTVLCPLRL